LKSATILFLLATLLMRWITIDFGTDRSFFEYNVSGHGMAGNAFDPDLAKVGDTVYLYHNDESYHAGLHRWKISNTENIKEFNFQIPQ